jgi:hypothetical protein
LPGSLKRRLARMAGSSLSANTSAELRAVKWFTLTHALGLGAFVLLMGSFFWYLKHIEQDQQRQAMYRDIEWAQQAMRLKWRELQDEMLLQAPHWASAVEGQTESELPITAFLSRNPEVSYLASLDAKRVVR